MITLLSIGRMNSLRIVNALAVRGSYHRLIFRPMATLADSATTERIHDYEQYLSPLSSRRQPSAIRKLLPLMAQEGMVSLGGGLPNPDLFPIVGGLEFEVATGPSTTTKLRLNEQELKEALQYSPTPGLPSLVKQLEKLQHHNHQAHWGDVSIAVTVGSQDALTKAMEMLLDPQEDELFVEDPTYSGALAFLQPFGVKLRPIQTDTNGLIPQSLEEALRQSSAKRRVLYTIPTAQNPSGSTLSNDRRRAIYELAQEYDCIILEDDPYYFLHPNYKDGLTSFLEMDNTSGGDGRVLRFDSFSKIISAGLRVGFVTGPVKLLERLNYHTQATQLHNSGLSQAVVAKLLQEWDTISEGGFEAHAQKVAEFYQERGQVLHQAAERHLTGLAEWSVPEAGMFLWMDLACSGITDTMSMIENKAAKAKVLLVPGQSFSPTNSKSSFVRASFSTASNEEMELAVQRLADLIRNEKK